jgi:hypothetical protein
MSAVAPRDSEKLNPRHRTHCVTVEWSTLCGRFPHKYSNSLRHINCKACLRSKDLKENVIP